MSAGEGTKGYVTRDEFAWWRRRATGAFVFLAVVSCVAAYLAYDAGRDSASGLSANTQQDALRSCVAGGELRITIAEGFDRLRTTAIQDALTGDQRERFIAATQPAVDRLLSQAAGQEFHAPIPPGAVTQRVREAVRRLSRERCKGRIADSYASG